MAVITLFDGKIVLDVDNGGGSIQSNLERETCPFCNQADCVFSCNGSQGETDEAEEVNDVEGRIRFNGVLDGIESMLLGCAVAGLIAQDEDPVWNNIIKGVLDGAGNNL